MCEPVGALHAAIQVSVVVWCVKLSLLILDSALLVDGRRGQCRPLLLLRSLLPATAAIAGAGPVSFPVRRRRFHASCVRVRSRQGFIGKRRAEMVAQAHQNAIEGLYYITGWCKAHKTNPLVRPRNTSSRARSIYPQNPSPTI
jgi:hypothetical protein